MKKTILKSALLAVVSIGLMAGNAMATAATWTDSIDWDPDLKLTWNNDSVSYTHDITDEGFDPWLDGNTTYDVITDYTLTISLYDDSDKWYSSYESVFIDQAGILGDTYQDSFNWSDEVTGWSLLGLVELNSFGTLDVTISRLKGDFYVDASTLVANGCDMPAPVPEPATMLLFGTGLAGLAGFRRRKSQEKDA